MPTATKKPNSGLFMKGISGNPGGRPKKDPEVVQLLKAATPKAARKLIDLLDSPDERLALQAANSILDRVWGKPEASGTLALTDGEGKALTPPTIVVSFTEPKPQEE